MMMTNRFFKIVTYRHTFGEQPHWLIENSHIGMLNKRNRALNPMIVEQFSWEDFTTHRHSKERSRLFKKSNDWIAALLKD